MSTLIAFIFFCLRHSAVAITLFPSGTTPQPCSTSQDASQQWFPLGWMSFPFNTSTAVAAIGFEGFNSSDGSTMLVPDVAISHDRGLTWRCLALAGRPLTAATLPPSVLMDGDNPSSRWGTAGYQGEDNWPLLARQQGLYAWHKSDTCSLLCVMGGMLLPFNGTTSWAVDASRGAITRRVDCSDDGGYTWAQAPPLPTATLQAHFVPVQGTMTLLSRQWGILQPTLGPDCSIVGWVQTPASMPPVDGRLGLTAAVASSTAATDRLELFVGGGLLPLQPAVPSAAILLTDLWSAPLAGNRTPARPLQLTRAQLPSASSISSSMPRLHSYTSPAVLSAGPPSIPCTRRVGVSPMADAGSGEETVCNASLLLFTQDAAFVSNDAGTSFQQLQVELTMQTLQFGAGPHTVTSPRFPWEAARYAEGRDSDGTQWWLVLPLTSINGTPHRPAVRSSLFVLTSSPCMAPETPGSCPYPDLMGMRPSGCKAWIYDAECVPCTSCGPMGENYYAQVCGGADQQRIGLKAGFLPDAVCARCTNCTSIGLSEALPCSDIADAVCVPETISQCGRPGSPGYASCELQNLVDGMGLFVAPLPRFDSPRWTSWPLILVTLLLCAAAHAAMCYLEHAVRACSSIKHAVVDVQHTGQTGMGESAGWSFPSLGRSLLHTLPLSLAIITTVSQLTLAARLLLASPDRPPAAWPLDVSDTMITVERQASDVEAGLSLIHLLGSVTLVTACAMAGLGIVTTCLVASTKLPRRLNDTSTADAPHGSFLLSPLLRQLGVPLDVPVHTQLHLLSSGHIGGAAFVAFMAGLHPSYARVTTWKMDGNASPAHWSLALLQIVSIVVDIGHVLTHAILLYTPWPADGLRQHAHLACATTASLLLLCFYSALRSVLPHGRSSEIAANSLARKKKLNKTMNTQVQVQTNPAAAVPAGAVQVENRPAALPSVSSAAVPAAPAPTDQASLPTATPVYIASRSVRASQFGSPRNNLPAPTLASNAAAAATAESAAGNAEHSRAAPAVIAFLSALLREDGGSDEGHPRREEEEDQHSQSDPTHDPQA